MRCRPKGGGERAISRGEFDAAHQGGDVDTHRYRRPFTLHNTHGSRVNDDLLWNSIIDVEDGKTAATCVLDMSASAIARTASSFSSHGCRS